MSKKNKPETIPSEFVDPNQYYGPGSPIMYTPAIPTLRDQFAMGALAGLIHSDRIELGISCNVQSAYAYADAMIEHRKKK